MPNRLRFECCSARRYQPRRRRLNACLFYRQIKPKYTFRGHIGHNLKRICFGIYLHAARALCYVERNINGGCLRLRH